MRRTTNVLGALTCLACLAADRPPLAPAQPAFVPGWARGLVWYQILPETFRNGDPGNDVTADDQRRYFPDLPSGWRIHPWTSDWYALSEEEKADGKGLPFHLARRRYGGDLQGIIDRLDYLRDLGIGGIYLNPIFHSLSYHKYDALCFHHVDPNLGPDPAGDRALMAKETPDDPGTWVWTQADRLAIRLLEEAHRRGMRVMLDGAFHHLGVDSFAFRDVREKGERSRFKDWFTIYSFADPEKKTELRWKAFFTEYIYAALRKDRPEPNAYIFASTARWTRPVIDGVARDGVDGWRLDVADMIPHEFWKDWSARVRALNPEVYLMGECVAPSGAPERYVHPEGFSAVMGYGFKAAVEKFFVTGDFRASQLEAELARIRRVFPAESMHAMYNPLDTHDTERMSSRILNPHVLKLGDARDFGNPELSGLLPDFDTGKPGAEQYRRLKLVAIFHMTYVGAPALFHGDEVGMWGACRNHKPMVWEDLVHENETFAYGAGTPPDGDRKVRNDVVRVEKDVLEHFRKLIRLRREHPALRIGDFTTLVADDARELLAFSRSAGDQTVVVILNAGSRPQKFELRSDRAHRELLNADRTYPSMDGTVEVPVEAGWGAVLVRQ
jgi:glycosidase